jgi:predicted phage-related endonuclease
MRVVIKASEVAAICGLNRYKPRNEVLDEMWKKYSPETFTGRTKNDRAEAALGASAEAQKVLSAAVNIKAKDSTEVQTIFEEAKAKVNLDPKLSVEQKAEVIEHLRSKVYTSHGTRTEDKTSDKVEADTGAKLIKDNAFYNIPVCTLGDVDFVVTGRIDRIEQQPDGSMVLVEIKNRTNRLFKRVVEYEMVQVQVYLRMLGLVYARLIEQYNNQVLSHPIDRDEEFWNNIIKPGLEEFAQELYSKWNSST